MLNNLDFITVIISASVALITSVIVTAATQNYNWRQLQVQTVTASRSEWMKNVRNLLSDFGIAFRKGEPKEMENLRLKLLLYMRADKVHYDLMTEMLNVCCNNDYDHVIFNTFILVSQRELARVWIRFTEEASLKHIAKQSTEDKIIKTVDIKTNDLLQMIKNTVPSDDKRFTRLIRIADDVLDNYNHK